MITRWFMALFAIVSLTGCGFTPLYSTEGQASVINELRSVHIAEIKGPADPSRLMHNQLRRVLTGNEGLNARYQLNLRLRDQRRAIAVTRSANTTRFDYQLRLSYTLTDTESGSVRTQNLDTIVSYGVVDSQYSSLVGREDAVRRATIELSRKLELDLALFLKGRSPDTSSVELPDVILEEFDEGFTATDSPSEAR